MARRAYHSLNLHSIFGTPPRMIFFESAAGGSFHQREDISRADFQSSTGSLRLRSTKKTPRFPSPHRQHARPFPPRGGGYPCLFFQCDQCHDYNILFSKKKLRILVCNSTIYKRKLILNNDVLRMSSLILYIWNKKYPQKSFSINGTNAAMTATQHPPPSFILFLPYSLPRGSSITTTPSPLPYPDGD